MIIQKNRGVNFEPKFNTFCNYIPSRKPLSTSIKYSRFYKNFGKKFKKKMLEKSFDKKNFGKINYKTKIFITKIYSSIDECHTVFAFLVPFDKTGRKTGSNENVCGIWFKIGFVARSHWTQGIWRFERSREKRYTTTWAVSASSVVQNFSSGLAHTIKRRAFDTTRKSSVVYISCSLVVRYWIYRC